MPKVTAVAPVKFEPVIVMVEPAGADVGEIELITGGGIKVNPANVAVPAGLVTAMLPVLFAGTTAVILVDDGAENEVAATPPKVTAVMPLKPEPVMVTVEPIGADVGEKDDIVGAV